jgi:hypothetical protein
LLAAGYSADDVQIEAMNDEAGPVQGNFTVGNGNEGPGGLVGALDHLTGGDNHNYGSNYKPVKQRGTIRLMVAVDSDDRHAQANAILDRADASAV